MKKGYQMYKVVQVCTSQYIQIHRDKHITSTDKIWANGKFENSTKN